MRPLNRRRLREYSECHAEVALALRHWWDLVHTATWHDFSDVRRTFSSASYVDPYVVFNIKGNDYRLVAWINYKNQVVVMKWFGTHAEYDKEQWK